MSQNDDQKGHDLFLTLRRPNLSIPEIKKSKTQWRCKKNWKIIIFAENSKMERKMTPEANFSFSVSIFITEQETTML